MVRGQFNGFQIEVASSISFAQGGHEGKLLLLHISPEVEPKGPGGNQHPGALQDKPQGRLQPGNFRCTLKLRTQESK